MEKRIVSSEAVENLVKEKNMVLNVKHEIDRVIKQLSGHGSMYRYLTSQYPILVDDKVPPMVRTLLNKKKSPACFTGDYIAFSSENCARIIASSAILIGKDKDDYIDYEREIKSVLCHELTHALAGHNEKTRQLVNSPQRKDFKTFQAACEIEANRGYGVDKFSLVYKSGVTDELMEETVPDIRQALSLSSIFTALKRAHDDDINQENNQDNQGEQNEGQSNQTKKSEQQQGGNTDDSEQNQRSGEQEDSQDKSQKGSSQENQSSSLTDEQKRRLEYMSENSMSEDEYENEAGDNQSQSSPQGNETQDQRYGVSSTHSDEDDNVEFDDKDGPRKMLERYNDRCKAKIISQRMGKMRGVIKGDLSKKPVKTYSRPPRRTVEGDLMKKGKKKDKRFAPKILLALDCSGSMRSTSVTNVAISVGEIIKELGRSTKGSYICLHNGSVKMVKPLKDWKNVVDGYYAQGDNNFAKVYELALKLGVDVVLNVGDGCDSMTGHPALTKEFHNKKIKWYDINVSDEDQSHWFWREMLVDNAVGFDRELLDLVEGFTPYEQMSESYRLMVREDIDRNKKFYNVS